MSVCLSPKLKIPSVCIPLECTRTTLYKHVQNCLYKHAVTKECMQLHKPACSYITLY